MRSKWVWICSDGIAMICMTNVRKSDKGNMWTWTLLERCFRSIKGMCLAKCCRRSKSCRRCSFCEEVRVRRVMMGEGRNVMESLHQLQRKRHTPWGGVFWRVRLHRQTGTNLMFWIMLDRSNYWMLCDLEGSQWEARICTFWIKMTFVRWCMEPYFCMTCTEIHHIGWNWRQR